MLPSEQLLDDLADAVLDGGDVDWAAAESSADADIRPLVRHMRLVASVAEVHRQPLPGDGETWGHLRLLERVGCGAFGEVFRAWDTRLDREVALKLLTASPDADKGGVIIREGRLLARVRHPNVVTIHGAERIGDRVGLWMEFVHGRTLEDLLKSGTSLHAGRGRAHRSGDRTGGCGRPCRGAPPSRRQGAERDASRRRAHRADGLRQRAGAGRRRGRRWRARRCTWHPSCSAAVRRRQPATSTASACCSSIC